jgi:hypothetical protein
MPTTTTTSTSTGAAGTTTTTTTATSPEPPASIEAVRQANLSAAVAKLKAQFVDTGKLPGFSLHGLGRPGAVKRPSRSL